MFLLQYIIPILLFAISIILAIITKSKTIFSVFMLLGTLVYCYSFIFWLWAIYRKIEFNYSKNAVSFYDVICFLEIVYISSVIIIFSLSNFEESIRSTYRFLIPIHFLAIIGSYYCIIATAKKIKEFELGKHIKTSNCILLSIYICLFPISIWKLQPRINLIYSKIEKKEEIRT
jgi:hypothetical protein